MKEYVKLFSDRDIEATINIPLWEFVGRIAVQFNQRQLDGAATDIVIRDTI
jgi:hypothetical protein